MKEQLLILVDALLAAKAALLAYTESADKDIPRIVERLEAILYDPKVTNAMNALIPAIESPNVVPFRPGNQELEDVRHALWQKE
jgi:hypothetical protein